MGIGWLAFVDAVEALNVPSHEQFKIRYNDPLSTARPQDSTYFMHESVGLIAIDVFENMRMIDRID